MTTPSSTVPRASARMTKRSSTPPRASARMARPSSTMPKASARMTTPSSTVPRASALLPAASDLVRSPRQPCQSARRSSRWLKGERRWLRRDYCPGSEETRRSPKICWRDLGSFSPSREGRDREPAENRSARRRSGSRLLVQIPHPRHCALKLQESLQSTAAGIIP